MSKKKLELEWNEEVDQKLRWVTLHLPNAPRTVSRAVRVALQFLELALVAQERGAVVLIREKDGTETGLNIG